jgi:hypothetical protein
MFDHLYYLLKEFGQFPVAKKIIKNSLFLATIVYFLWFFAAEKYPPKIKLFWWVFFPAENKKQQKRPK